MFLNLLENKEIKCKTSLVYLMEKIGRLGYFLAMHVTEVVKTSFHQFQ